MEGTRNLNSLFFVWWYGEVFHNFLAFSKHFLIYITDLFSVRICILTIFSPWKRDSISYENLTIQERGQVLVLNLTSRFVGAIIKLFTLATFCVVALVCIAVLAAIFLLWLIFPLVLILLCVWGIKLLLIK